MNSFQYINNELYAESVPLNKIAQTVQTPCYIYSLKELNNAFDRFENSLKNYPHQINYAVKANSNLSILNFLKKWGAGFDIVSQGELERVLKINGDPKQIVFSGVGKTSEEIAYAIKKEIGCFNVESQSELYRIQAIAKALNTKVSIAIRVNPDVDAESHPYISTGLRENKFGIDIKLSEQLCLELPSMNNIDFIGIAFHIGSQITTLKPLKLALNKVLDLIEGLESSGIHIQHLNIGGGLGIRYREEVPPTIEHYIDEMLAILKNRNAHKYMLHIEPGRAIVANSGILLTKVEYIKQEPNHKHEKQNNKHFAILDAAMNDLMRPTLYNAWQEIIPVKPRNDGLKGIYDLVGPVCESGDFLGLDRDFCLKEQDLLAIMQAGAYGFSMSSNYNSRTKPAEVLVDGKDFHLIRERETISDLFKHELCFK